MADPGWAHRRLQLRQMQRGGAAFARSWARYPKSFAAVWMAGTWRFFKLFVAFPGKLVSRNFQVGIFNANLVIPWSCQIPVRRLYQNSQKGWNFPVAGEVKMYFLIFWRFVFWPLPNSRLKGNLGIPPTLFQVFEVGEIVQFTDIYEITCTLFWATDMITAHLSFTFVKVSFVDLCSVSLSLSKKCTFADPQFSQDAGSL